MKKYIYPLLLVILIVGIISFFWSKKETWSTYTNSNLGYTVEYPASLTHVFTPQDQSSSTTIYKDTPSTGKRITISVLRAHGTSIPEWLGGSFKTEQYKKITVAGGDAYVSKETSNLGDTLIQLIQGKALYQIFTVNLSQSETSHIVNSFKIDFVPENP